METSLSYWLTGLSLDYFVHYFCAFCIFHSLSCVLFLFYSCVCMIHIAMFLSVFYWNNFILNEIFCIAIILEF